MRHVRDQGLCGIAIHDVRSTSKGEKQSGQNGQCGGDVGGGVHGRHMHQFRSPEPMSGHKATRQKYVGARPETEICPSDRDRGGAITKSGWVHDVTQSPSDPTEAEEGSK